MNMLSLTTNAFFKGKLCSGLASIATLLVLSTSAQSDGISPDRFYLSLVSYHAGIEPKIFGREQWNEVNPGVVLTWEDRILKLDYSAGLFKNSFDDFSTYFSVSTFFYTREYLSIGGYLALADYGENVIYFPATIGSFAAIPGLQINYLNTFVQLQPAPQENNLGGVLVFGFTSSFR
jgi:hypothetical protein